MKSKIFISSVQSEFVRERKALSAMIRNDRLLRTFFDVFVFEEAAACNRKAQRVYLDAVSNCDIYLGLFGERYGNVDEAGVSPTEREFDKATELSKIRLAFVKKAGSARHPKETEFLAKVGDKVTWHEFKGERQLKDAVYDALFAYLEQQEKIRTVPWDAAFDSGAVLKDLDTAKIRRFVARARNKRKAKFTEDIPLSELLPELDLMDEKGRVSNAAVMLFGKRPQKWFVTSEVKCVQFWGTEVVKPVPSYRIFEGDVFELIDQALDFVMSRVDNYVGDRSKGDTGEVETEFELPETAVKEAIVNAVCHRDYTSNASVQVMLFKDRLEIINPGKLPPGWTVENLFKTHKSDPPNKILARPMYLAGYVEKTGSGTRDIVSKCLEKGLAAPEYHLEVGEFRAIIWRKGANTGRTPQVAPQDTPQVTPQDAPQVTPQVKRVLRRLASSEVGLSAQELLSVVGITDRKGLRIRYLEPLLNCDWIAMTVPAKPNSRLQKYRLTAKGRRLVDGLTSRAER